MNEPADLDASPDLGNEERFRLLVESVIDYAIFMLQPDGTIATWNAGAERLKGYRADEIVGQHYSVFYPPESVAERLPDRLLAEAREHGRTQHSGWRVRKDGSTFWADVVITALHEEDGTHAGFAKVTRDRTDSHLAEEARVQALAQQAQALQQLEELDQWRQDFIRSIVHDLQTPMIAVAGFADLLRDPSLPDDLRREAPERILSNVDSVHHMLDNLRSYLGLDVGRVELELEPVDLQALLRAVVADLSPVLADRPVDVDLEALEVRADAYALERVFRNLLANVAQHTTGSTPVHLRGRTHGDTVVVDVADEGHGVPADLAPTIFDRFRANGSTAGTGLGLAIAREYVELHGGTIELVDTERPGATFRCVLPTAGPAPD